ncbi:WYL domain-containing protein, partial [Cellulosimicrobium funkei]
MSEPTAASAPSVASSSGGSSTNPAARLLNLVIALVNTNASMTKQQIRSSVAGYGDAPSPDAFERMFERDKDTLRDLGIPIVTVDAGGHADEVGYRIDQDAYALPAVDLTPAELGVLALAAQFWQDKTLRTDISRALTKLRAAGAGETAMDVVAGLAPRVRAVGDAYATLMDAISARRVVSFTYRAASTGEVRPRRVQPWRIAARRGGWYLVGLDLDRGAPRSYRLSRVEGRVRASGPRDAFEVPAHVDVDAALGTRDAGGLAR